MLIIGAGLSGVGAACHLKQRCPAKTFAILEGRGSLGGTWDLFRYPGIRSDSDMFTLGYAFRPWSEATTIADGAAILKYIRDTAAEHGVAEHIRFHHKAVRAAWSTAEKLWTVEVERTDTGARERLQAKFLFLCTGYYRYDAGYTPEFPGQERFGGRLVHPQKWPADLDYSGKRVVVIGSGATAVTLVPAMAERAAHVTMLQRSPTYIISVPRRDSFITFARARLAPRRAYALVRWRNILIATTLYAASRRTPRLIKRLIRRGLARALPPGFDIDTHFKPRYEPWDERLCLVPDGDLFRAIKASRATVVTGRIAAFTENGVRLESGAELPADIIVTATGLNLLIQGGIDVSVDGRAIRPEETIAYKGMMTCGIPNLAYSLGYTNASWTLKCDLVCEYVCRLLTYMDERGVATCTPRPPPPSMRLAPLIDLRSGYVRRSLDHLPRQATSRPWRLHQNYIRDLRLFRRAPLDDGVLEFR